MPDVLQDGVQTLQGGGGEGLGPQLVVEDVELVSHVIQLPPHLGVGGHCKRICYENISGIKLVPKTIEIKL